jgi:hypothetical protein
MILAIVAAVALAIVSSGSLLQPVVPPLTRAADAAHGPSAYFLPGSPPARALVAGERATASPVVSVTGASATPARARAGDTERLVADVSTNATLRNALVDFEVYNAEGAKVYQMVWPNTRGPQVVSFVAGRPRTFQTTWHVPGKQAADTFTFKVGVFGVGWKPTYVWDNAAATFTVGTPAIPAVVTITGTLATPVLTTANTPEHLVATISASAPLNNTIVDFEVYNALGKKAFQQVWPNTNSPAPVNFAAHRPVPFHVIWKIPAGASAGIYTLKVGVFGAGWSRQYAWANTAATFTINPSSN